MGIDPPQGIEPEVLAIECVVEVPLFREDLGREVVAGRQPIGRPLVGDGDAGREADDEVGVTVVIVGEDVVVVFPGERQRRRDGERGPARRFQPLRLQDARHAGLLKQGNLGSGWRRHHRERQADSRKRQGPLHAPTCTTRRQGPDRLFVSRRRRCPDV